MAEQLKLRDQAYEVVAQHLVEGSLVPGQFVSQRELAALTNMSLAAIREMIPRLEAEGLIKAFSQRGLQIAHVDLQMVTEAFQVREMVETTGLTTFSQRASDAEIKALYERFLAVKAAAEAQPYTTAFLEEASACDWAMHDAFVSALNNDLIANIHRVNTIRIRMILGDRIGLPAARVPVALREHEAVLNALLKRDHKSALRALRAHLQSSCRRSLSVGPFDESQSVDPESIRDPFEG